LSERNTNYFEKLKPNKSTPIQSFKIYPFNHSRYKKIPEEQINVLQGGGREIGFGNRGSEIF